MIDARRFSVSGIVQGVGFRPFVARLAEAHGLRGWVLNATAGVEIHVEGAAAGLEAFARALVSDAPPAARVDAVQSSEAVPHGCESFEIRSSDRQGAPTALISPDLPVCADCLRELRDPASLRFGYAYINCTNCGPRYSLIHRVPYDRANTSIAPWTMCEMCRAEYEDPRDRRYHAEPIACHECGPRYSLIESGGQQHHRDAIARTVELLHEGAIVAVKGIGGYHLSCDAANPAAIEALRDRKYRKSRPFAVMAKDLAVARGLVALDDDSERLLTGAVRPIVLAPARRAWPGVAPGHRELGVMLPYAPIHHLLFDAGAPAVLVMTSANRASEPIAFDDADARERLEGIADAFLIGERPIVRRVDDSIVRRGAAGPVVLRRGRGLAPSTVARLPPSAPLLAVGGDLKNTVTLVIGGEAIGSQHVGDLEHFAAYESFRAVIRDLTTMYDVRADDLVVVHDLHPGYASTRYAIELPAAEHVAVQHHRAHIASVLAERGAFDRPVVGVAFDGTGYGDDGTVWGGEFFVGSVASGFTRAASLHPFPLPGGDAAARYPVQAAAGVLYDQPRADDLTLPPFSLPDRYGMARRLIRSRVRTFTSTSAGRLFDAVAALLGFTERIEYEGQAAVWLEELAASSGSRDRLPFVCDGTHLDWRPALAAVVERRRAGEGAAVLARAFHETFIGGIAEMVSRLCERHGIGTVVLSGGTFQNALLVEGLCHQLRPSFAVWTNSQVPSNDGGLSLGQAALALARARRPSPDRLRR